MKARFEQLFYGRGEGGYGVLGVSPAGRRFAARVEVLCGGVGTAGGDYGGEPFLLSVPEGECVVMACGRRGGADAMGRNTLFFHVLIAPRATLDAAGADAFSLFAQGAFAERMPGGDVESVELDVRPGMGEGSGGTAVALPVAIRSGRPEPEAVRALAGGRANALSWATCAFQFMEGFDIQVVPQGAVLPRGVNECDAAGRLVRGGGAVPRGEAEPGRRAAVGGGGDWEPDWRGDADTGAGKPVSGLWKLSLAVNAVLAVLCAWLWLFRSPAAEEGGGGGAVASVDKAAIERAAVERYRAELARSFPREARIADFGEAAQELPFYEFFGSNPKYRAARDFVDRAKIHVDFVNDILGVPQPQETTP